MDLNQSDPSLKSIDILEALKEAGEDGLGITEVADAAGLNKSTVHRIMLALTKREYVTKNEATKKYRLGYKILQFSAALLDHLDVKELAHPYLQKLSEDLEETVHLVQQDGSYGVYVDKIDSPHPIGLLSHIGKRIMLHNSAAGKVILSYMSKEDRDRILTEVGLPELTEQTIVDREILEKELRSVIETGHAWNRGESRIDVYSIAAPIFDARGKVIYAVSVAGPSYRFTLEKAGEAILTLMNTTKIISEKWGYLKRG
jgi:DNA-binding IclR family transcriptional regulator